MTSSLFASYIAASKNKRLNWISLTNYDIFSYLLPTQQPQKISAAWHSSRKQTLNVTAREIKLFKFEFSTIPPLRTRNFQPCRIADNINIQFSFKCSVENFNLLYIKQVGIYPFLKLHPRVISQFRVLHFSLLDFPFTVPNSPLNTQE